MDIIRTARLELVPLNETFVDALKRGDLEAAEREIGARVSPWLMSEPSHPVQLLLAQSGQGAEAIGVLGRAIVVMGPAGKRRVVGSAGFHGPPDERGRLELGCDIEPASRRHGYAAEAMRALVDWAAHRFGITRFVVAFPLAGELGSGVPVEIGFLRGVARACGPRRIASPIDVACISARLVDR